MQLQTIIILLLIGLAAGLLSGMVGVGGGIIIVPCLIFFVGFTQKTAQGNSLGLLLLPLGVLGVMNYWREGHVDYRVVLVMAIGFVLGNFFGSKWALGISDDKLKKIFAIVMLIASVKMLFFDKPKTASKTTSQVEQPISNDESSGS
jgi:uncharacterized membrane protein YfcA